jgi:hypothetical protein
MTEKPNSENKSKSKKLPEILLFWSTWLFVVFLSKKILSSPSGNADFLLKNLGSFISAIILTGAMIHFLPKKIYIVLIPLLFIGAAAFAVF